MFKNRLFSAATVVAVLSVLTLVAPARADAAASPYGANNWACKPSAAHPYPVVLVHGTYGDQKSLFDYLSWAISASGYCVFALDYGFYGTNAVAESAGELSAFVDKVLAATGADKVSIVGHSQGGMMPRYYIKFLGGADKVDDLVGIVPDNHGTTWTPLLTLIPGFTCQSCIDQMAGSPFLTTLNEGDETPGPVSYTTIVTAYDRIVTPYTSGYLTGPNVTNIRLQDLCPSDTVDHVHAPEDPAVIRIALDALSHDGPADPEYRPRCSW